MNYRRKLRLLSTFDTNLPKVRVILWLEKNKKDLGNYLFAHCKDKNAKPEGIFNDATSIQTIINKNVMSNIGFLVEYPDINSANAVIESLNEKNVSVIRVKDFKDNLSLAGNINNLGEYGTDPDKKIVVIQAMELDVLRNMFPSAVSIQRVNNGAGNGQLSLVEFKNAEDANAADAETVGLNCMSVILMNKYFEERKIIASEEALMKRVKVANDAMESREVTIELEDGKIIVEGGNSAEGEAKKEAKKVVKEVKAKNNEKGKKTIKHVQTQTKIDNKLVSKRKYQVGQSDWDPFVVCSNFVPKDKSLGTPNEDDICKYFIHNHKNVVDVKFPRWNERTAFVKFNSKDAADSFLELDYVMFFGADVGRNIMGQYLKNKTHDQKNEVSMKLLNKPYVFGTVVEEGNPFHIEFSGLSSKNEVLRNLFVNKLNLAEKDVGKMTWETVSGELKARVNVKVPEAAVHHLIGRWNSMSVSVAGQEVSAEFWVPKGTKRHGDMLSKKQKKKNRQEGGPMLTHY